MLKAVIKQMMATRLGKADFKVAENNFNSDISLEKPVGEMHLYTTTLGEALPGACLPECPNLLVDYPCAKESILA